MKPKRFYHRISPLFFTGIFFLQFSIAFSQKNDSTYDEIPLAYKVFEEHENKECASDVKINKKRFWFVTGAHTVGYGASLYGLSQIWYNNFAQDKFHSFNDMDQWGGMDKFGHVTTAWQLSNFSYRLYRYTNMKNERAAFVGSTVAMLYQTTLEIFDGYAAEWGFSWGDMGANLLGAGFAYLRNTGKMKNIQYKFSYYKTKYPQYRPNVLGKNSSEQVLKDYNGQNYWLSINLPKNWFKNTEHNWLCFSIGYSIDGFTGGSQNYFDASITNPPTFERVGEFFFSFDIDFTKLNIKSRLLKNVLKVFNVIKIPCPAIGVSTNGKLLLKPFYF
jgi:uncharacterized protein YfiM (DUF2279 family)